MSSTETPKKRGRPKGSTKPKPKVKTDIVTKEPLGAAPADAPTEEERQAVRDVLKEAEAASAQILHGAPDVSGVSPTTDASVDPGQADFIPGTRPPDMLYLPERVYDERTGVERRCSLPNEYHYCWVEGSKITSFRIWGYRLAQYDGGPQSGLAPGGLSGTHLYERTLDNHVRHGDVFLMWIPIKGYEVLKAEDRKKIDDWNMVPKTEMHDAAYSHGVRSFEEVDGVRVNN